MYLIFRKGKEMRTKENKGVTLIALAVTVIVLLIISGVTISYMTGENGIINQSKESKKFAGTVEEKEVLNTSVAAAVGKSSEGTIIYVPDTGGDSEKTTIDLYYDELYRQPKSITEKQVRETERREHEWNFSEQ